MFFKNGVSVGKVALASRHPPFQDTHIRLLADCSVSRRRTADFLEKLGLRSRSTFRFLLRERSPRREGQREKIGMRKAEDAHTLHNILHLASITAGIAENRASDTPRNTNSPLKPAKAVLYRKIYRARH